LSSAEFFSECAIVSWVIKRGGLERGGRIRGRSRWAKTLEKEKGRTGWGHLKGGTSSILHGGVVKKVHRTGERVSHGSSVNFLRGKDRMGGRSLTQIKAREMYDEIRKKKGGFESMEGKRSTMKCTRFPVPKYQRE